MATRKKIKAGNLEATIRDILREYGDDVRDDLAEITMSVADATVKKLRDASKAQGWSEYAKGWTKTDASTRLDTKVVVHHTKPGMPHLLENGHLIVSGGKTVGKAKAFPHIKGVEDEVTELYQKEVVDKL